MLSQFETENEAITAPTTLAGVTPDGRYLLVQTRPGSLSRLDLQAPFPGKLEPLAEGLGFPSLSPDGRNLAWGNILDGGLALQTYPPAAQPLRRFVRGTGYYGALFFSSDVRTLFARSNGTLLALLFSQGNIIGEPTILRPWTTTLRLGANAGAASRDGNRLLLLETDQEEILTPQVLTDWTTLLPK